MPSQVMLNRLIVLDSNGDPAPGAKAYFYESGTSTPITVYSDSSGETPHPTPVVADSEGLLPPIFHAGAEQVKVTITDRADTVLNGYPMDPAPLVASTGSAASAVTFAPMTGNAATNVQDAIENNTDRLEDITAFGWSLLDDSNAANGRLTLGLTDTATAPFLDEDGMASNSPTSVASQQSIKAYVDNALARGEASAATTSGTEVNISTAIPAGIRWIEVGLTGVSLSGTNDILVQLSTSSTFVTSGYVSASSRGDTVSIATVASTAGFIVNMASGSNAASGLLRLSRSSDSAFRWVSSHGVHLSGTAAANGGGEVNLGGVLDGLRVKTTGANTFDAGTVYIRWGR